MSGQAPPTYLSAHHDPLYRFHEWQANLRILNIREIKTVPYVPRSHPVVERLIGTVRRECVDRLLFWTYADLEQKLVEFQEYATRIVRMRGGQGARRRRLWTRVVLGQSLGVSVAAALSWAVSHAKRRVTDPIRRAFTAAVQEFATHRSFSNKVAWS